MNETNGNRKACNSIIFEDDAKVITFAEINSDNVKDFPLILGEVGRNEVVAPENPEEAKELAKQAEKLKARYVVLYQFGAMKLRKNTSNKRYYIDEMRYVYNVDGRLENGFNAGTDSNEMTVVQAALYTDRKIDDM